MVVVNLTSPIPCGARAPSPNFSQAIGEGMGVACQHVSSTTVVLVRFLRRTSNSVTSTRRVGGLYAI